MAPGKFVLICLLGLICFSAGAQVNRYMVFFTDKSGSPFSIAEPSLFLSEEALSRRVDQGIAITQEDLPVNQNYVQTIRESGIPVYFTTRWMNGVLVACTPSQKTTLEGLSFVQSVELVAPGELPEATGRISQKKRQARTKAAETDVQLEMLGIDQMHALGYRGEGITIAVLDVGFPGVNVATPFQALFSEGRFNDSASFDFVHRTPDVFQHDDHGTGVFSVMAAFVENTHTGGAYKANYQVYITEDDDSEYRIEEYNWLFAAERADSAGVDIINSSLGYNTFDDPSMDYEKSEMDGNTTVITRAAQLAAARGMVIVASAGNEGNNGWGILTAPSDGKDVLAVASVTAEEIRSNFSSRGISFEDGRVKPDVAAMGSSTSTIEPDGSPGHVSGTSLATPLITSLAAGIWQRYPGLLAKEVNYVIRRTCSQSNNPDSLLGYGIPDFKSAIDFIESGALSVLDLPDPYLQIFPNPFAEYITIRFADREQGAPKAFAIFDSKGKELREKSISLTPSGDHYNIDCSALSPGIYFLRMHIGLRVFTHKIVKL